MFPAYGSPIAKLPFHKYHEIRFSSIKISKKSEQEAE
jgi:hypothetical protein